MTADRAPPLSYRLVLWLEHPRTLRIGALGVHTLPAGRCVYTGSARRHPRARLERRLGRRRRRLRWHIDYVIAQAGCRLVDVALARIPECELNERQGGSVPVPGFGASDRAAGCGAHLRYLGAAATPLRIP